MIRPKEFETAAYGFEGRSSCRIGNSIITVQRVTTSGHLCYIAGVRFNTDERIGYAGYRYTPIRGSLFL